MASTSKEIDITKTGPQGFRQLQNLNQNTKEEDSESTLSDLQKSLKSYPSLYDPYRHAEQQLASPLNNTNKPWGESRFDNNTATGEQFQNLGDYRANQQSGLEKIANGIAKGAILAGTTFLDGTVGLLVGGATAIAEGRWSGLWDNDFSKAMQSINEASEEILPNYYSEEELNAPWTSNIFSANFIGDKFLKNLGFTVGAFYSGNVVSKALVASKIPTAIGKVAASRAASAYNAAKKVGSAEKMGKTISALGRATEAPAMVTSAVGATFSAVNEGRIEALNNTKDWYNLNSTQIQDYFSNLYAEAQAEYEANQGKNLVLVGSGDNAYYIDPAHEEFLRKTVKIRNDYEQAMNKLSEDRAKMGNADLLMNIPILVFSNLIEFGKLYAGGYKTARKATNIVNKGKYADNSLKEVLSAAQKKGVPTEQALKEFADFGVKETRKGLVGGLQKFGKNLATTSLPEGLEEISQKAASTIAGDYYGGDVHDFYKSKTDPDAAQENLNWLKAFARGINETINEGSSWEEFFIGALTGALGMPVFGSANTSSQDTYLGRNKAVGLRGGIIGSIRENKSAQEREANIANYINNRLQSNEYKNYYQGLNRHKVYQEVMNEAAKAGDAKTYKDAEHAQLVSDIMMFDNAGRLGDLLTLIDSAYDVSPENLASIVENTSSVQTLADGKKNIIGPFSEYASLNSEGKIVANFGNEEDRKAMAEKLTKSKDEILKAVNDYRFAKEEIDLTTGQQLNDDQLQELTWMKVQSKDWLGRGVQLSKEVRDGLLKIRSSFKDSADLLNTLKTNAGAHQRISKKEKDGKTVYVFEDNEMYNKLSEAEKRAVQNITAIDSFLGESDEGLFFALSSPNNAKTVDSLKGLFKDLAIVSPTDVESFNTALDDISKLKKGIMSYDTKLREYLKNPEKQASEMANADAANVKKSVENSKNAIARRINFNAPTAEVAKALDENSKDIVAMGGFDEFIKTLTPEQRNKVKAAKRFSQALNSIKDSIETSDLSDEQKRLANNLVDKEAANAENIYEVGAKVAEALDRGDVREALISSRTPSDDLDDSSMLHKIEDAEAKLKEFFDTNIAEAAKAITELEKSSSDKLKEAADKLDKMEKDTSSDSESSYKPPKEKNFTPPKEPKGLDSEEFVPEVGDVVAQTSKEDIKKNPKITPNPNPGIGGPAFHPRPQFSEYYLHGRNGQTYLDYINEHPEEIPEGVDKEAFIKYVDATITYLKNHNAFEYVANKLSVKDTITFKVDPELNKAAGVPVVLMVVTTSEGTEQVIGSLPTSIDFQGINKQYKKPEGEVRAAQKALYEAIINKEKAEEKQPISREEVEKEITELLTEGGSRGLALHFFENQENLVAQFEGKTIEDYDKAIEIVPKIISKLISEGKTFDEIINVLVNDSRWQLLTAGDMVRPTKVGQYLKKLLSEREERPITTKVGALRGGKIEFSDNLERSVATIFSESDDIPVIAVLNEENSSLSTGSPALDSQIIQLPADSNASPWSVYVMIPTNNGKLLPALCYSTKLSDIIDDPEDWYIQQIVDAIKEVPKSIADLNDNIKIVYKWLPLKGFSIKIGRLEGGNFNNETEDISKATHVRINFSNSVGKPDRVTLSITDGQLSDEEIRRALKEIIKKHPNVTTNVNINKLTNTEAHKEYRKNIAKYLHSNVMFPHAVNDWFNYELTEIERNVNKKENVTKKESAKPSKPDVEGKGRAVTVIVNNTEYTVLGTHVEDANGNAVSESTRQAVLAAMSKPAEETPVEVPTPKNVDKAFMSLNMGGADNAPKIGRREARVRKFGSKKLAVTDTSDRAAKESQIYKDVEKVRQMFPQLSRDGRIVIVNGLIKTVDENNNPIKAYGEFRDGILYISNQSPAGTAYHEAFHYVTDMLMSESDRVQMMEAARAQYGELPELALEEKLAEDFRHFMNDIEDNSLLGKIKTFFRNLKNIINNLFGRITYLDNLFFDIYKNRYQNVSERFGTFEEQRILRNAPRDENIYDEYQSKLLAYKTEQLSYDKLDESTKESLEAKRVSKKDYEKLNIEDKESILFCLL